MVERSDDMPRASCSVAGAQEDAVSEGESGRLWVALLFENTPRWALVSFEFEA